MVFHKILRRKLTKTFSQVIGKPSFRQPAHCSKSASQIILKIHTFWRTNNPKEKKTTLLLSTQRFSFGKNEEYPSFFFFLFFLEIWRQFYKNCWISSKLWWDGPNDSPCNKVERSYDWERMESKNTSRNDWFLIWRLWFEIFYEKFYVFFWNLKNNSFYL